MNDLMHDDGGVERAEDWEAYLQKLQASGCFSGASAIGGAALVRKTGDVQSTTAHLTGYIGVEANDLTHACTLLDGNPVYKAAPRSRLANCRAIERGTLG